MRSAVRRVADWEIFLVAPAVALLAFTASLPNALVVAAFVWIGLLWLARWLARGQLTVRTPVDLPVLLLLALLPLNLYASADSAAAWRVLCRLVGEIAALYAVVNWVHPDILNRHASVALSRARRLNLAFIILGAGVILLALLATNFSGGKILNLESLLNRLPRFIAPLLNSAGINANLTGGLAAALLPLALVQILWGANRWARLVGLFGALVLGGAVLVTQSRGAWLGVGGALVVIAIAFNRRAWLVLPLLALALGVAWNALGTERLVNFIAGGATLDSGAGRIEIWQRAIYMLQDFPFTGAGLGNFGQVAKILYPFFTIGPDAEIPHAHNLFLQAAVDFGAPGALAVIGFFTALVGAGLLSIQRAQDTAWRPLAVGLFAGLVVFMIHGLFDMIAFTLKTSALLYASFGLLLAVARSVSFSDARGAGIMRGAEMPLAPTDGTFAARLRAWFHRHAAALQTVLWWLLISLLAIGIMGEQVVWGMALLVLGGVAVGLQSLLRAL